LSDPRTSANLAIVNRHGDDTSRMCSLMQARRLLFPDGVPGHKLLRSATQDPTANLACAVAFDAHNIKMAAIIRMIFTKALLPTLSHPRQSAAPQGPPQGPWPVARPNGGVADSLDEAKAAFRAGWDRSLDRRCVSRERSSPASAFLGKSGREMLTPSISFDVKLFGRRPRGAGRPQPSNLPSSPPAISESSLQCPPPFGMKQVSFCRRSSFAVGPSIVGIGQPRVPNLRYSRTSFRENCRRSEGA
jgi:hypothetical protein